MANKNVLKYYLIKYENKIYNLHLFNTVETLFIFANLIYNKCDAKYRPITNLWPWNSPLSSYCRKFLGIYQDFKVEHTL